MVIKILYLLSGRLAPRNLPFTHQPKGHIQTARHYGTTCRRHVKDMGFLCDRIGHNRHGPRDLLCLLFNKCDQTRCMSMRPEEALTTARRLTRTRRKRTLTLMQMHKVTRKKTPQRIHAGMSMFIDITVHKLV